MLPLSDDLACAPKDCNNCKLDFNRLSLIQLTTSQEFDFNSKAKQAFTQLKSALTNAPVLAIPDDSKPYELVTDASAIGCGAVLLQEERPVAFWSYKMKSAETRYHTGEQELLAVVKALEHWRHYPEGALFLTIVTDHKPNVSLDSKSPTQLSRRQVRWQQFHSRFDFQWEWRKGINNVADPLSRNPAFYNTLQQTELISPSVEFLNQIATGYQLDSKFSDEKWIRKFSYDGQYW